MTYRSMDQGWILNALAGVAGLEVLHPGTRPLDEELGFNHGDTDLALARVKSGSMFTKAWAETAADIAARAQHYERAGFPDTARDLYLRACMLWGQAQYTFFNTDPRKARFAHQASQCLAKVQALSRFRIERVEVPFESGRLCGLLLTTKNPQSCPTAVLLPGMDMIKEQYIPVAERYYLSRGWAVLALDGPGQGETRATGVTVNLTNYEQAVSAMVDYLCSRPEVDRDRLGLWGMSMGSYWGLRCAALEPRLKAVATALGCYSDMRMLFDGAQPNFKRNYMFMSGYEDEDAFDRELAAHMNLWDLAPKITCAVLMAVGEFDELMNLSDAYKVYDMLAGPKELCVLEDEFHPLGGVAAELMSFGAEWLAHGVAGDFSPTRDERRFMRRSGEVCEGSAQPPWWTPTPGGHGTL